MKRTPNNFIALKNIAGSYVGTTLPISKATFPVPFYEGLTYSPPARGGWNIVHIGLTLPQAHLIFVCPEGCLRGVVLSAAELGVPERFSTIAVGEDNILSGDIEDQIITGVSHIIDKLPKRPPAVLVYTSCIHQFLGIDIDMVYDALRADNPDIDFTDCYMFPIMRKSGPNPVEMMRRQLYSLLTPIPKNSRAVNIIGSDLPLPKSSDLYQLLAANNFELHEIGSCQDYQAYKQMAASSFNITILPSAIKAGELLAEKLQQTHIYLPMSFNYAEIDASFQRLSQLLGITYQRNDELIAKAERALAQTKALVGNMPIAIDYTAGPRPLSLTRMLLEHGFNVTDIYVDSFQVEEEADLAIIQKIAPNLKLHPTIDVGMRAISRQRPTETLAIGQKAAYFSGATHFVNIIEGGGLFGVDAVYQMAKLIAAAYQTPQDTEALIQVKALNWGCECNL